MGRLQFIPSFYFYKFANAIADPYTSLDAYRNGAIDESGNIKTSESNIDPFEYFVIKLKKIFEQLPPGMTRYKLSNLIGTMQIFSEEAKQHGLSGEEFNVLVEAEILLKSEGTVSYLELLEDMATGGGAGALGVPAEAPETNKGGVSGYDPRMGNMFTRSEPLNMIAAVEMFNVPSNEFKLFKASKYYPKSPTGNYLRRFGHRNPNARMAVKDEETGEIYWLPKATKKSLAEEIVDGYNDLLIEAKRGQISQSKFGTAQYKGIGNFLSNHMVNSHGLTDEDNIKITELDTQKELSVPVSNFKNTFSDLLINHHSEGKKTGNFKIQTAKGELNINAPHVASTNPNDLTIKDSLISKDINVDMKSGRGRWQFKDKIDGKGLFSSKEFPKVAKTSNSFVAFHDDDGTISHIDSGNLPLTRKYVEQMYHKSGSSSRPGSFAYPGEVNIRGTKKALSKSAQSGIMPEGGIIPTSAQKRFVPTMIRLTGIKFGTNDMYTKMLRGGKL
jgi:hypothetical protein